jgi:4-amino-4-deoxy-L-arabinose transferase-like glycosyltransferase
MHWQWIASARALSLRPDRVMLLLAVGTAWLCVSVPVFAQEAYYWCYARHPDLSYFDHPPLVAWLIWLGTACFGDGAFGIRFGTWLCGLATTAVGTALLRAFGVDRVGQSAWIALSFLSPILLMTHFLANPDPGLACGSTVVMYALWRARAGGLRWWLVAGVAAGVALLSKYSAAFLGLSGALLLLADPPLRRQLRRPGPWLAVAVAGLVFLPVVVWNLGNDFESFRFQTGERYGKAALGLRRFGEFALGQFVVLHPVLMLALPAGVGWLLRRVHRDPRALWLLAFGLPLPLWMLGSSFWIEVKLNWLASACVPLVLGLVVWWREHPTVLAALRPRLAQGAAIALLLVPALAPFAPLLRLVPAGRGTSWSGWDELAQRAEKWEERLDQQDDVDSNVFFFAADYRDAAQLYRNLHLLRQADGHHAGTAEDPGEPTLAQNVLGMRALQFDHWTPPRSRIGQDAVFVLPRPARRGEMVDRARKVFAIVELAEHVQVECMGIDLMEADIYVCRDYLGPDAAGE